MKRILIAVPSFLVIVLVLLLIGPSFVDWSSYKTQAQDQIKKATGHDAELRGDLQLAILPSPHIMIEDLVVKAPAGSTNENLISLKRLNVNLAFAPLLGGNIVVDSVNLIEPQINLEVLKSGKPNWITPKIEKKLDKKKEATEETKPAENKLAQAISLQKVNIEGGSFSFQDQAKGSKTAISNIDAALKAETLEGPYKLDGSFAYGDYTIDIIGGAGRYSADTKSIVPKIKAKIAPLNVEVEYTGVLSFDGAVEVQGETNFSLTSLEKTLSAFGAKNLEKFNVPLTGKGLLTASQEGLSYKDLSLNLAGNEYTGSLSATLAPLNIKTSLVASTPPKFAIWLPSTLNADINLATAGQKTSIANSVIKLDDTGFTVTGSYERGPRPKADVTLVSKKVDLDAWSSRLGKEKSKPTQVAQNGGSSGSSKPDIKAVGQSLMLPMDLDFDLDIGSLRKDGRDINGIRAKGELRKNSLNLERLAVQNVANSSFSLKGAIGNLKDLSGIDMNFSGASQNIKALASSFGADAAAVPDTLGKVEALAAFKGSAQNLDLTSNVKALGGELITQGVLNTPLQSLQIEKLTMQVKHSNMAQALRAFNPSASSKSLAGPVDLYAAVNRQGTTYKFTDVLGKLAGTALEGGFEVETGGAKPQMIGSFKLGDLVIDTPTKGASKASSGGGGASGSSSKGSQGGDVRWSREAINTVWMHSANADFDVVAKSITYGKWKLQNPVLKAKLNNGVLDISQLDAGLFGGKMALNANIKSSENPRQPIHIKGTSQLRDVSVEQLFLALSGNKVVKGKGNVSMDVNMGAAGISPAALVYDLNGKGSVTGKDLVLEGYDLTRFAAAMSDDTKLKNNVSEIWGGTQGGTTTFDTMDGTFTASEGVINVTKLDLESEKLAVAAKGTINLPRWWIDMPALITMKPPYDIPPYTIPIEGPLDNPKAVTQNVLGNFLTRKLERKLIKEIGGESNDIGNLLGKVLNVPQQKQPQPVPTPEKVAPSGGEEAAQPPPAAEPEAQPVQSQPEQPKTQEQETEELIRGVIDLFGN
ncbi:MAG: hypothetical protein DHS20C02_11560 [Micavibrio sp.]|nr:MAG: hypothetical protein DHS20C02_11560 [Micavibrio sp.]